MTEILSFDEAEAFGFDGAGNADGERSFPYTKTDVLRRLLDLSLTLIGRNALRIHDGAVPYVYEITDPALARTLAERYPDIAGDGEISEDLFNIEHVSGRPDFTLPLTETHVRLYNLLRDMMKATAK